MLSTAFKEDADVVYCDVELVYDDKKRNYISHCSNEARASEYFKCIDTPLMAASWNKIIKRELYNGMFFPVGMNNEDVAITPIILAKAKKIIKINKPYYKYYQRTGSIQNSGFSEKRFVIFETTNLCFSKISNFPEEIQEEIKGSIFTHQILAILLYILNKENFKKRKEYIKLFIEHLNKYDWDILNNKYVIEYVQRLRKTRVLKLIQKKRINELTFILSYYNFRDKIKNL